MTPLRFKFVGRNRKFNQIVISDVLTIDDIMARKYESFFSLSNKGENGNCEFIGEIKSTGLLDKNEKEIFFGDLVEIVWGKESDFYGGGIVDEFKVLYEVVEDDFCFHQSWIEYGAVCFMPVKQTNKENSELLKRGFKSQFSFCGNKWEREIIGNKFENPELLKS